MQKSSLIILWASTIIILAICAWALYFALTNFLVPAASGTEVEDWLSSG